MSSNKDISETNYIARPANCFMIWSRTMRNNIYINNPELNNIEISKLLGTTWMNMSDEDKLPYIHAAQHVKQEHKLNNPNYKYKPKLKKQKKIQKKIQKPKSEKKKYIRTKSVKTKTCKIINIPNKNIINPEYEPDYYNEVELFYKNII